VNRLLLRCLFLSLLLSACAQLHPPKPEPISNVQQLSTEHRYLSALKALNAQRAAGTIATPDYEQQRDAILVQARAYQSEVLRTATELMRQQQFSRAATLVDEAQAELPASLELSQFREQLGAARERYTQRTLDELIPLKAVQLQKEHALYQALQKTTAEPELQNSIARHQAEIDYFLPMIVKAGNQALAQNDFNRAQHLLSIANQLAPSPTTAQSLTRAEQAIVKSRKKQQVAQSAEREQRYREVTNAMLQSLQQRDFVAAREQLAQARELNIHAEEMDSSQRLLDNIIANYVVQQIDAGDKLYADGKIEEALRYWRQAEALSPTPDIKEKIEKAQKFIDRLEQLKKTPAK
jgi:hypothetical protein